jgi:hypothetical protein
MKRYGLLADLAARGLAFSNFTTLLRLFATARPRGEPIIFLGYTQKAPLFIQVSARLIGFSPRLLGAEPPVIRFFGDAQHHGLSSRTKCFAGSLARSRQSRESGGPVVLVEFDGTILPLIGMQGRQQPTIQFVHFLPTQSIKNGSTVSKIATASIAQAAVTRTILRRFTFPPPSARSRLSATLTCPLASCGARPTT